MNYTIHHYLKGHALHVASFSHVLLTVLMTAGLGGYRQQSAALATTLQLSQLPPSPQQMAALITMIRNVQLFTRSHSTSIKPAAGQQSKRGRKKERTFHRQKKKTTKSMGFRILLSLSVQGFGQNYIYYLRIFCQFEDPVSRARHISVSGTISSLLGDTSSLNPTLSQISCINKNFPPNFSHATEMYTLTSRTGCVNMPHLVLKISVDFNISPKTSIALLCLGNQSCLNITMEILTMQMLYGTN